MASGTSTSSIKLETQLQEGYNPLSLKSDESSSDIHDVDMEAGSNLLHSSNHAVSDNALLKTRFRFLDGEYSRLQSESSHHHNVMGPEGDYSTGDLSASITITTTATDSRVKKDKSKSGGRNVVAWTSVAMAWTAMGLAILSGASIGPIFKYLSNEGIPSCLAACWRSQSMCIFMIPFAIMERLSDRSNKVPWLTVIEGTNHMVITYVIIAGSMWACNLIFWIIGLRYTNTFKAAVFASLHPLMLCFWFRFNGVNISNYEWAGVFVCLVGMFCSGADSVSNSGRDNEDDNSGNQLDVSPGWEVFGLFLCVLAAVGQVAVVLNRIIIRPHVPIWQYTAATTTVVLILTMITSLLLEQSLPGSEKVGEPIQVFCLQTWCVFGWFNKEWFVSILMFGLIIGVLCITGFNYAMAHISPLTFCALVLLDPAITAILSWLGGIERLPEWFSWVGGSVVMLGVGLISYGEQQRELKHLAGSTDIEEAVVVAAVDALHREDGGSIKSIIDSSCVLGSDGEGGSVLNPLRPESGHDSSSSSSRENREDNRTSSDLNDTAGVEMRSMHDVLLDEQRDLDEDDAPIMLPDTVFSPLMRPVAGELHEDGIRSRHAATSSSTTDGTGTLSSESDTLLQQHQDGVTPNMNSSSSRNNSPVLSRRRSSSLIRHTMNSMGMGGIGISLGVQVQDNNTVDKSAQNNRVLVTDPEHVEVGVEKFLYQRSFI